MDPLLGHTKIGQAKYFCWSASMTRFKNMHGHGEHRSVETVELILHELRSNHPKKIAEVIWVKVARLGVLGRTLFRGPTVRTTS